MRTGYNNYPPAPSQSIQPEGMSLLFLYVQRNIYIRNIEILFDSVRRFCCHLFVFPPVHPIKNACVRGVKPARALHSHRRRRIMVWSISIYQNIWWLYQYHDNSSIKHRYNYAKILCSLPLFSSQSGRQQSSRQSKYVQFSSLKFPSSSFPFHYVWTKQHSKVWRINIRNSLALPYHRSDCLCIARLVW